MSSRTRYARSGDVAIAYAKRSTAINMNPTDGAPTAPGGDLIIREKSSPSASEINVTADITQGNGDVSDPEVSYDGRKIVFAMRCPTSNTSTVGGAAACTGRWNIWEYDMTTGGLAGGSLRRVTSSTTDDDVDPAYLPAGRGFVFSSNRQTQTRSIIDGQAVFGFSFGTGVVGHGGSISPGAAAGRPRAVDGPPCLCGNGRGRHHHQGSAMFASKPVVASVFALLVLPLAVFAATTPDAVVKAQLEKKGTPYEIDEDGDFAILSVAVVLGLDGKTCSYARIALGAAGPTPVRSEDAEAALVGKEISDVSIKAASAALVERCDPVDDFRGSADYRRRIMPRSAPRIRRKPPERLTSSTVCQSWSFIRSARPSLVSPALLTSTSRPPSASARAISRSAASASASSAISILTRSPSAAARASSASRRRPAAITVAPWA